MSRNVVFAPLEFYHIYNRGTEKREVFLNTRDYQRFISLLYLCNSDEPVDLKLQGSTLEEILKTNRGNRIVNICSYCLMPNHFHFILQERESGGISRFMQKLTTGYTMYFNKLNNRTGALFQGRFKAKHTENDSYLSYLISYIHLNPIKIIDSLWKENGINNPTDAEVFLDNYNYSSYKDYCGCKRLENKIISMENLPKYSDTAQNFKLTTLEWLKFKDLQGSTL